MADSRLARRLQGHAATQGEAHPVRRSNVDSEAQQRSSLTGAASPEAGGKHPAGRSHGSGQRGTKPDDRNSHKRSRRASRLRLTDEITALCLEGEFDIANAPQIIKESEHLLANNKQVVLDLSKATFIDCSVIQALTHVKARQENGCAVVLQLGQLRSSNAGLGPLRDALIEQFREREPRYRQSWNRSPAA